MTDQPIHIRVYDALRRIGIEIHEHRSACAWLVSVRRFDDALHPASVGCLLALVRDAWGDPLIHVVPESVDRFTVWAGTDGPLITDAHGDTLAFKTEAEALVAALEATQVNHHGPH